jgi:hypothetical protein
MASGGATAERGGIGMESYPRRRDEDDDPSNDDDDDDDDDFGMANPSTRLGGMTVIDNRTQTMDDAYAFMLSFASSLFASPSPSLSLSRS